ncbi:MULTISPECIES: aminopeptidase N [Thiomicrorhabdus]|uniref:Aminopeptidase N n=1 Tax=Thiomicrorhabdus heinhorstiae TaxID=2748010 RepID=A0ABS0C341_9GAMM|nr:MULTISPECIES: aminopeptidase N [Thiomicrorhabdus]MBF6058697.1 aminopeptidase N [Thiomicrorhabdus heinhorstiae]
MLNQSPKVNYLKDYQAPKFEIAKVDLQFELEPNRTRVKNTMRVILVESVESIRLDGENLSLISVVLDGKTITEQCSVSETALDVPVQGTEFTLEIETLIDPQGNTALEGLYRTSGNYCTQCEAEGFRKITYYPDRPDVLSYFTTKIIADEKDNKVLLSNGNLIDSGSLEDGRHFAVWHDPFKKPCYLFALVAGNLEHIEDEFITRDQRSVTLRIYVEPKNIDQCEHAMESLKRSMKWDEERFGLIYDLDIYMIVAVDDFNMGAMENKGLNVFNSKFVLAKPETATDIDYEGIESVIGHEYFHNWTGNRVTCRDWFQLTLKEGLTVFRDQEFTSDMLSPAVKRIEDVKRLRTNQFPEDAGPMAHPIQPQSYIEMNNFYTMTVYEKGAEVVRLYHTLLGEEGFRQGMDLYFQRHDGQAVTVDCFRNAMADANKVDLQQMKAWYLQAGTPRLEIVVDYDSLTQQYRIEIKQSLRKISAEDFQPLLIPLKMALFDSDGKPMQIKPAAACRDKVRINGNEAILIVEQQQQSFEFTGLTSRPVPSWLRGFSAPVKLAYDYSQEELACLAANDDDSFVRWESMQTLSLNEIKQNVSRLQQQQKLQVSEAYFSAFEKILADEEADPALIALAINLPDMTYIGEQYDIVDVDAIYSAHRWLREQLAERFEVLFVKRYQALNSDAAYRYAREDIAQRKLKNVCLAYLSLLDKQLELVLEQCDAKRNMTDVLAALDALSHLDVAQREERLQDFYQQWRHEALVLDKWFALQAASHHIHALEHVKELIVHADFTLKNPNRVRSVLGVFGRLNLLGFHRSDGAGYQFLAEQVLNLDAINPQVAARIVAPFTHWKRYDASRQVMMKQALQTIADCNTLSKDVYEIVSKSLAEN